MPVDYHQTSEAVAARSDTEKGKGKTHVQEVEVAAPASSSGCLRRFSTGDDAIKLGIFGG